MTDTTKLVEAVKALLDSHPDDVGAATYFSLVVRERFNDLRAALDEPAPEPKHDNEWFNRQFLDPEFRAAYEAELKKEWELERSERAVGELTEPTGETDAD